MAISKDDDSKTIYSSENYPIKWLNKTHENHLDITTFIFGPTRTGKSTLIEEILYLLKEFIPNYIVVAPVTSKSVYINKLPDRCIMEDLTKEKMQKIWQRQVNITQIYNIANNIDNLKSLFIKAPDREAMVMVQAIAQKAKEKIAEIETSNADFGQRKSQTTLIKSLCEKKLRLIYKSSIRKYKSILAKHNLNEAERITLEYLDMNPRLMLIIDDCSEKFKTWMGWFKKGEDNIFECILYRGRHNFITLVIAAHDDKLIPAELRKNARVTIFTNAASINASLERKTHGFSKKEIRDIIHISEKIFTNDDTGVLTYQKFCYVREDPYPFRYTIADLRNDFNLAPTVLRELIDKMPSTERDVASNPLLRNIIDEPVNKHKPRIVKSTQRKKPRLKYD